MLYWEMKGRNLQRRGGNESEELSNLASRHGVFTLK